MTNKEWRSVRLLPGIVAVVLLGLATSGARPASGGDGLGINAFAKRAAGSYLAMVTCDVTGPRVFPFLVTFGADGTYVSEDSSDAGDNPPGQLASGLRGNWVQTGRRELALSAIDLEFGPGGVHVAYLTWNATVRMDPDFDGFTWQGQAPIFLADQDPLDPNAEPIDQLECGGTARRIPIMR